MSWRLAFNSQVQNLLPGHWDGRFIKNLCGIPKPREVFCAERQWLFYEILTQDVHHGIYVTTSLQRYACWEIHARTVSPTKDLDILSVGFHSVAYPHIDFDIAEPLIKWLMFPHILLSIKGHTRPGRHDRNKVRFSGQKVTAAARMLLWWCWCQMMSMFSSAAILLQSNGSFLPAISDAVLWRLVASRILEADLESSEDKADSSLRYIVYVKNYPWQQKTKGSSERVVNPHCSVVRSCKRMLEAYVWWK